MCSSPLGQASSIRSSARRSVAAPGSARMPKTMRFQRQTPRAPRQQIEAGDCLACSSPPQSPGPAARRPGLTRRPGTRSEGEGPARCACSAPRPRRPAKRLSGTPKNKGGSLGLRANCLRSLSAHAARSRTGRTCHSARPGSSASPPRWRFSSKRKNLRASPASRWPQYSCPAAQHQDC